MKKINTFLYNNSYTLIEQCYKQILYCITLTQTNVHFSGLMPTNN